MRRFILVEHIYKDAEMAAFTLQKLEEDLKEKDNKIKQAIHEIYEKYEYYKKESEKILKENNMALKEEGIMNKMGADMGIKKEVRKDNSDAAIAHMLIEGISMGTSDMEKKIKQNKEIANKEIMKLAHSFLKFQKDSIQKLKEYV